MLSDALARARLETLAVAQPELAGCFRRRRRGLTPGIMTHRAYNGAAAVPRAARSLATAASPAV